MVDPYSDNRDGRGRFTKGNVGRLRGTFTWLTGVEFKEKYRFLNIVKPTPCPECSGISFRFNVRWDGKRVYSVCARCNHCNSRRWYKPYLDSWNTI